MQACLLSKSGKLPLKTASSNRRVLSATRKVACAPVRVTPREDTDAAATSLPYSQMDVECAPSLCTVDNSHPSLTKFTLIVKDAPSLLRTIIWVLNGMGVRTEHADLQSHDGYVHDTFWVTTKAGKKLSDDAAHLLRERLQEFAVSCRPICETPTVWAYGDVEISNTAHPHLTQLVIRGEPGHRGMVSGFLLDLSSVIAGTGAIVHHAQIQGSPLPDSPGSSSSTPSSKAGDGSSSSSGTVNSATNSAAAGAGGTAGTDSGNGSSSTSSSVSPNTSGIPSNGNGPVNIAPPGFDFSNGRYFKFLISDRAGNKLDPARVQSLLFVYQMMTGKGHMPLKAPNMEMYERTQIEVSGCV